MKYSTCVFSYWLFVLIWGLCYFSETVMAVEKKDSVIKILAIGNSFSQDAVEQYLYDLAKSDSCSVIIGNMYIGGCSLEGHVNNARTDAKVYYYRKIGQDGRKTEWKNVALDDALREEDWDYVSLQQASTFSGVYDTYVASLPELVAYVKQRLPAKVTLMLHQTWAYSNGATHVGFKEYNRDQLTMYRAIVNAVKRAGKLVHIKMIIPSGTAIQNARTSFLGDTMNRDGYHLNLSYGRYTAACTWFEKIFHRNVIGNSFRPTGVSEKVCRIVQIAAHEAVKHPYKITNLSGLK